MRFDSRKNPCCRGCDDHTIQLHNDVQVIRPLLPLTSWLQSRVELIKEPWICQLPPNQAPPTFAQADALSMLARTPWSMLMPPTTVPSATVPTADSEMRDWMAETLLKLLQRTGGAAAGCGCCMRALNAAPAAFRHAVMRQSPRQRCHCMPPLAALWRAKTATTLAVLAAMCATHTRAIRARDASP